MYRLVSLAVFEFLGVADWVIWYLISQYVGLAVFGGYLLYKRRFKIGFKAVFLRKEATGWVIVGSKEFKAKDKTVKYGKKKAFKINLKKVTYRERGYQNVYFDYDKGDHLTFKTSDGLDPIDAGMFLAQGVMERIVDRMKTAGIYNFVLIVITVVLAVMCFFIGLLLSPYVLPVEEAVSMVGF